jgi:hypothetical protein
MVTMRAFTSTVVPLALLGACMLAGQQPGKPGDCEERVFSAVRHIAESDDYVGTEFVLTICANSRDVSASWNEYEGYHPVTTKLKGVRTGKALRLEGSNSEGRVAFTGELSGKQLKGALVWYIGKSRQNKKINLAQTTSPVRPPG